MNERAVYFGPHNGLLGILTMPAAPRDGAPAVVLLNAGLLHRVGPNRLHVEIARRLGEHGYSSLRFDMSGVGDSELVEGGLLDIDRSVSDVVAAMDAVGAATGADRFVIMGLCTGAFNGFRAALRDDRVAGCVLIDGYAYPTPKSQFRHYRTRVLQLDRWMGYVKRRLGRGGPAAAATPEDLVVFENEVVPKERFGRELASLIDRGTSLLMVYTKLGPLAFNYERQMHDAFPEIDFGAAVIVRYYPNADHTFTLPGNRRRLLDEIESWMRINHAGGRTLDSGSTKREKTA